MTKNASPKLRKQLPLAVLVLAAGAARAAGGHHAVDDAAILDERQCQFESWIDVRPKAERLAHLGTSCRAGAVEVGLAADRSRVPGTADVQVVGPQVKWATLLSEKWSAGISVAASWRTLPVSGFAGATVVVPVTWRASDTLSFHVNVGRDFLPGQPNPGRSGIALEWAASPQWSIALERFHENDAHFARAGARWQASPNVSVDISRAHGLGPAQPSWWTLGINWLFER